MCQIHQTVRPLSKLRHALAQNYSLGPSIYYSIFFICLKRQVENSCTLSLHIYRRQVKHICFCVLKEKYARMYLVSFFFRYSYATYIDIYCLLEKLTDTLKENVPQHTQDIKI